MYYCSAKKHFDNSNIKKLIPRSYYLYYDFEQNQFISRRGCIKDIKDKEVTIISDGQYLTKLSKAIKGSQGTVYHTKDDVKKIVEWYKYIEPKRFLLEFEGDMINDENFLKCIKKIFGHNPSVYLSTNNRDFSQEISLSELFISDSPLRTAMAKHSEEIFIISEKIEINEDEYGKEEYEVLVEKNRMVNIIRTTETPSEYKIPSNVIKTINEEIIHFPKNFPDTFVLKIASYQNMYEILELIPLEKYDLMNDKIKRNSFAYDYNVAMQQKIEQDFRLRKLLIRGKK